MANGVTSPTSSTGVGPVRILPSVAVLLAIVAALLYPGRAPLVNDDSDLLLHALAANHEHRIESRGLTGSFNLPYGPMPTQFYQACLVATKNPFALVILHGVAFLGIFAAALWWLARTMGFSTWFVTVVLLAPRIWYYSKSMWDNPLAIPVGTLAFAAYASFYKQPSGWKIGLATACLLSLLSIHPMTLPLVMGITAHVLILKRKFIWEYRFSIAVAVLAFGVFNAGYFLRAARYISHHEHSSVPTLLHPEQHAAPHWGKPTTWRAFVQPLNGGAILTPEPFQWVGAALGWVGIAIALRRFREPMVALCLAILVLMMLMSGFLRLALAPHYFNGIAVVSIFFVWLVVEQIAALLPVCAFVFALGSLHYANVWAHGPVLRQQVGIVRALRPYNDKVARTDVEQFVLYPQSLWVLRELEGRDQPGRHSGKLFIHGDANGRLTLLQAAVPLAPTVALEPEP